jgi:glycosyltransferase involved in cell wall biosynthesis
VHFHRFEFDTEYPPDVAIDHVDAVVFAGPHFREDSIAQFGWPPERCVYVPNPVDVNRLQTPKSDDAQFTLGLLGWHRQLKRLDLALDTLERLRAEDDRFRLTVKGQSPKDYAWVWEDDAERGYFEEQLERIETSPLLRDVVDFEGFGDVVEWFSRVGWITSFSDVESFHLAVAEGMAGGAVPLIRRREGVEQLFPQRWVFDGPDGFAGHVLDTTADGTFADQGAEAKAFIAANYDLAPIGDAWVRLVFGEDAR